LIVGLFEFLASSGMFFHWNIGLRINYISD